MSTVSLMSDALRARPVPFIEHPRTIRTGISCMQHANQAKRCVQANAKASEDAQCDRRSIMLGAAAVVLAMPASSRAAEEVPTKTLFGMASPPTSYGGYGGNAKEAARYTYEYPGNWKQETVGKQEKGMVGIDSRVRNSKSKLETAFTVTFGRAGEDNKRFKLGDVEATLQGFAGADYQLQDALLDATNKTSSKRTKDGLEFYDYEIFSPEVVFLASVGLYNGKVYALFVKSPAKMFKQNEKSLRNIIQTFTLVKENVSQDS